MAKFLKVMLIADLVALAALLMFAAAVEILPFDWMFPLGLDPHTVDSYTMPLFGFGLVWPG